VRKQATRTLQNFTDDNAIEGEDRIPRDLIADAAGLAFMTFVKIGMVFTGRIGTGTSTLLSKNCIDTSRVHRLHSARPSALVVVTTHAALDSRQSSVSVHASEHGYYTRYTKHCGALPQLLWRT
jgi:hypothetical protein